MEKANLTKSSKFCPICLLSMLFKAIEIVVGEKITYQTEKFNLFLLNHYGVFKQKSTINVPFIMQEKIYQV